MAVFGLHDISNATSAIALADINDISVEKIQESLNLYRPAERRFSEYKFGSNVVVDDYAHHPDEIRATIKTAKHYPHKKMWVVFQPHTYTRTKALLPEFCKALSEADAVVLADIYAAIEKDTLGISSKDVMKGIKKLGTEAYYFPSFSEIENFLLENCSTGDLLITMGAGDVVKIGEHLLGN